MKKLRLKEAESVGQVAEQIVERCTSTADMLPDETYQTLAEASHRPPAQYDAFSRELLSTEVGARLKSFVERVQNLKEEAKNIAADIKEVMDEAAGVGFDKAVIKDVIKLLEFTPDDRETRLSMIEVYLKGIGEGRPGM